MPHSEPGDFLESLSDDEKLISQLAFNQGLIASLTTLLHRVSSFYSLLELELEDSPAGQAYHKEGAIALEHAEAILGQSGGVLAPDHKDFERFDLQVLLRGMATRISRIGLADYDLDFRDGTDGDCQVAGNLHLLQEMLFALPYIFGGSPDFPALTLYLRIAPLELTEDYLRKHRGPLQPGRCYAVSFGTEPLSEVRLADLVPLAEKLTMPGAPAISQRLTFCHGVALQHGGDLMAAKSEADLQTLTWILPLAGRLGSADLDAEAEVEDLSGTGTILLVDDEDIIWDVVIDMLQDCGYTVILAANGRDCVEIYKDNPGEIDLVLLDMVMPEMNGHEAFFALKELDPNVNVLLQSGYVAEEDAREVLDAGARGFLQKPYRMAQLARKIREILEIGE